MDKLIVVKIGGNIIDDEQKLSSFLRSFADLKEKKILVHGGGKLATQLAEQLDIRQQVIDGRRVTDAATLRIITMVYAGYINKNIVAALQSMGCNAIGLTGADANIVTAHKRSKGIPDYGFAGDIDAVHGYFLNSLLQQSCTPVIAPVTHDGKGQLLNTNADTIASQLAIAMTSFYKVSLVYCFEKEGVMGDVNDENSVIPYIDLKSYHTMRSGGSIAAGMIPKMDNAFSAIEQGVCSVVIGKAERLHHLITSRAGTTIQ